MVGNRSLRPRKPAGGKALSSTRKRKFIIQEEEEEEDEEHVIETPTKAPVTEPETELRGAIVAGTDNVDGGNESDDDEIDVDDLVSDVLRYYEDDEEDVDVGTTEPDTTGNTKEVVDHYEHLADDDGINEAEFEDIQGPVIEKKMVNFNDKGQPIGEEAAPFTSYVGSLMRKHCPITYEKWRDVPLKLRETLWKLVLDKYVVPVAYKAQVIERIHTYWRHHKSVLRLTHYDKYNTDEERKRHCPKGVRQDIWNIFVDNQSSPTAQARRKAGKHARQAMKTPHYTGRTGAARTEESLKKGDPLATVTRTDIYLAMHSPKDGSRPTPEVLEKVEKIKAIAQQNPSSINLDVDHDPVSQVCGRERSGRAVRGMGMGVSKSSLRFSAPVLDLLQKERKLRVQAEQKIAGLKGLQGVSQKPARRANQDADGRRVSVTAEERQIAPRVDGFEEVESCHLSAEQQIEVLKKQVVYQKEQIEQLQQERGQITELKKLIVSQGLMIADMRELITRLCP